VEGERVREMGEEEGAREETASQMHSSDSTVQTQTQTHTQTHTHVVYTERVKVDRR
jgi:hypothetical protein